MATTSTTYDATSEGWQKPASVQVVTLPQSASSDVNTKQHVGDWPNDAGWNATEEQRELKELPVTGTFPAWAAGLLLRTGPSISKVPSAGLKTGEFALDHWFDGFSTVHKFKIEDKGDGTSRVSHQSRHQTDELLLEAQRTGRLNTVTFGQKRDPCDSLFKKLKTTFEPTYASRPALQNVNVTLQAAVHPNMVTGSGHSDASRVYTTASDNSKIKSFDMETLEPFGLVSQEVLHPELDGQLSSAHAGCDRDTGDIFNFNLKLGPKIVYRVFRTKASDGSTEILATLKGLDPVYMHSSFLTDNFFVLCLWPLKFTRSGASMLWTRNIIDALAFDSKAKTTWVVVDRKHGRGEVARFTSGPLFCFHTVNAWETATPEGLDLECELVEYANADVLQQLVYKKLVSSSASAKRIKPGHVISRYMLRLTADGCKARRTDSGEDSVLRQQTQQSAKCVFRTEPSDAVELPTLNSRFAQRRHRYVYGIAQRGLSSFADGIGKTDVHQGTSVIWSEHAQTPGEAIFIERPGAESEDDGVLLSVVMDGLSGQSYLLCLDARNMQELGRAHVGSAVGFGLHGVHLPGHV